MGGISLIIDEANFTKAIQEYVKLTNLEISDVLRQQGKFLAERLMKLTYPFGASQGKKRVAIDIGKVFLANEWFEDKFQFRNQKLNERVQNLVRRKEQADLEVIFNNSSRLRQLHIEPFDAARHKAARKNGGRVSYKNPFSFPLTEQSKVKKYAAEEKKNVGMAKSGWGYCWQLLGGSPPGWLKRAVGTVEDNSKAVDSPYIILTNNVSYFYDLDRKSDIVGRAMAGRQTDMIKSAKYALERAARAAGLAG